MGTVGTSPSKHDKRPATNKWRPAFLKSQHHPAIPEGRYRVLITKSYRFGRWLPQLLFVPGFDKVRLTAGNRAANSIGGNILTGWNRRKGMVINSRSALQHVLLEITAAIDRDQEVWITIK